MPEVFKCSFREMRWRLVSQTEHFNTSGITSHWTDSFISRQTDNPWQYCSQDLNPPDYFLREYLKDKICENNLQAREDIIRREIRWIPQEMVNRVVDNFNVRVAMNLQ